jgi:hypothetical protein
MNDITTLFRKVAISERLPKVGEWVITIDTEGNQIKYKLNEDGNWSMHESHSNDPVNNNLSMVYWLEPIDVKTAKNLYEVWIFSYKQLKYVACYSSKSSIGFKANELIEKYQAMLVNAEYDSENELPFDLGGCKEEYDAKIEMIQMFLGDLKKITE